MHSLLRASALVALLVLAPSALAQDLAPTVYPNPISANRAVTVEVADADAATVEVVDVLGRVVSTDASLAAGTYLVRVRYADGRVTSPTSITVATPGRVELILAESSAPAALAPAPASPEALATKGGGGCSGSVAFGGFYHSAFTGSLRLRPDLTPKSLRAQPAVGTNTVDWTTCFGSAQGVSYRYIAGGDAGNRPLRVLSPATVGNTQASFTATYTADGGGTQQALYGTYEQFIDNDGNPGTATVPAVGVGFDASAMLRPRQNPEGPRNRGAGYQLLVFDEDGTLVYEAYPGDSTPLFVTPTGGATRVNLLRSILLSSVVDGFEVPAAGGAPGDLKVAMTFESGTGSAVNVHVGEGAPVATGSTLHITPTFGFSDPSTFAISDVRTYTTGVNRYGVRAIQFAGGGGDTVMPVKAGGGFLADGQWGRPQGEYVEPHLFDVVDAQGPFALIGSAGPVEDYGIQFGREPAALQETGSDGIVVDHAGFGVGRGLAGVILDEDGDFYRGTALIRNETDVQSESGVVTLTNEGGTDISVLVESLEGAFTTFEFVYDANLDGNANIRQDGTVGAPLLFGPNAIEVIASGTFDGDDPDLGSRQDYAIAFLLSINGNVGAAYIFPDWASANADVDVRSFATESHEPFIITGVQEQDEEVPMTLRGFSSILGDR